MAWQYGITFHDFNSLISMITWSWRQGIRTGVEPLNPYRLRSIAGACPLSKGLGIEAQHIDIEGGEA